MPPTQPILNQEESDLKRIIELISRNYRFFLICLITSLLLAFLYNRFSIPVYKISASMLIKEDEGPQTRNINEYLNSSLLGMNRNFQNELWVLKSSPVLEQTVDNLDLVVSYYNKDGLFYKDAYKELPFNILLFTDHIQPVNVRFHITIHNRTSFRIMAKQREASFVNFKNNKALYIKKDWSFEQTGKFGRLIETPDAAFIVQLDTTKRSFIRNEFVYSFEFTDRNTMTNALKDNLEFNVIDKQATVIQIGYRSPSVNKGKDIVNELMNVYSEQNLSHKNHIAGITIEYIEKQLDEISDSLNITEQNLQSFRSSTQLLNATEQATGITAQYRDLQNQLAEMVTRKKYYDYVADYLTNNNDFSNIIIPASMGIQDQLLNSLMADLIKAQAQRSNLIENRQEKNPMVQRLGIQIDNIRKTITENISAVRKTTDLSIGEMNRRIRSVESEISRLPRTQRQLGGIERKYKLNDAIYNYLLEKRAEAKITQASNLPDNLIIEPANTVGTEPVSPNVELIYLMALILGLGIPLGYLILRSVISNKLETQENIERFTDLPVLGKILHNRKKSTNVVFEYPNSNIAESYRALRTNLDYHFRKTTGKVILVTSSIEGEGKSFNAQNIAMSYAQMGRKTLLVDFDLRKNTYYFNNGAVSLNGLSSYLNDKLELEEIILRSPHEKLDYIQSGPIPPNPVELIAGDKTHEMITQVKSLYDCVVFDTPPLAQVTDAYLLLDYVDIKIIIARYNHTVKKVFSLIMKDLKQKKIEGACVVLNDNRINQEQYGYGYGYNKKL